MVVVMQEGATEEQIQRVINKLMEMKFDIHRSTGVRHTVLGAVGAKVDFDTRDIERMGGVEEVLRISAPYKLASRQFRPEGSGVQISIEVAVLVPQVRLKAGRSNVSSQEEDGTVASTVNKM